jgi:hypothetical protein
MHNMKVGHKDSENIISHFSGGKIKHFSKGEVLVQGDKTDRFFQTFPGTPPRLRLAGPAY